MLVPAPAAPQAPVEHCTCSCPGSPQGSPGRGSRPLPVVRGGDGDLERQDSLTTARHAVLTAPEKQAHSLCPRRRAWSAFRAVTLSFRSGPQTGILSRCPFYPHPPPGLAPPLRDLLSFYRMLVQLSAIECEALKLIRVEVDCFGSC